jgi:hypothetical protein
MDKIAYITRAQADAILSEEPLRYGVAHVATAETVVKGSKKRGAHGEEETGELLYAYDLQTGKPVKPTLKG